MTISRPKTINPFATQAEARRYLDWISKYPCAVCGARPPSDPMHQSILGGSGMGMKPPDNHVLPGCRDCHSFSETAVNGGIITLWRTKRPELWVSTPEEADPLNGKLYDKHDLRDYIGMQREAYFRLWLRTK